MISAAPEKPLTASRSWVTKCPDPERWAGRVKANSEAVEGGCWIWAQALDRYGYGRFKARVDGRVRQMSAHRAAWLALRGPIPYPLIPDHLCRNRACVNPDHMELVSNRENTIRGSVGASLGTRHGDAIGPTYPCGHERTEGNTNTRVNRSNGYTSRSCRACNRERYRRWSQSRGA